LDFGRLGVEGRGEGLEFGKKVTPRSTYYGATSYPGVFTAGDMTHIC